MPNLGCAHTHTPTQDANKLIYHNQVTQIIVLTLDNLLGLPVTPPTFSRISFFV